MDKFENKSRECYNDIVSFVSSQVLNIKKKEFLHKVKKLDDVDDLYGYVEKTAMIRTRNVGIISKELLSYVYYFNNVKRYWIPVFDEDDKFVVNLSTLDNLFEDSNRVIIELSVFGSKGVLLCEKFDSPILCEDVTFGYKVTWYTSGATGDNIRVPIVLASAYITKEDKGTVTTVSDAVIRARKLDFMDARFDGCVRHCLHYNSMNKETKEVIRFVREAVYLSSYVGYCIKNKDILTRKNGVASKVYASAKVHVAKSEEGGDRVISLHTYVKDYSYIGKQKYKGGHHKSPVEHDRRGYYRKSRGVGDYDYLDGEFIYVGKRKGSYSYVKASHITGNNCSVVYKV